MKCQVDGVYSDRLKKFLLTTPVDEEQLIFEVNGVLPVQRSESEKCVLCGKKIKSQENIEFGVCLLCGNHARFDEEQELLLAPVILFATDVRVGVLLYHRYDVDTLTAPLKYLRRAGESDGFVSLQILNEEDPYEAEKDLLITVLLDEEYQDEQLADRLALVRFMLPMPYADEHLPEILDLIVKGVGGQEQALEQLENLEQLDPLYIGYDVLIARTLESLGRNDAAVSRLAKLWSRALLTSPALISTEYFRYDWHPGALRLLPSPKDFSGDGEKKYRLAVEAVSALANGNLDQYARSRIEYCAALSDEEFLDRFFAILTTIHGLHRSDYFEQLSLLAKNLADDISNIDGNSVLQNIGSQLQSYAKDPSSFDLNAWELGIEDRESLPIGKKMMLPLLNEEFDEVVAIPYDPPKPTIPEDWMHLCLTDPDIWEVGSGEHRLIHRIARLFAQWREGQLGESACRSRLQELDEEYDIELLASDNESYYWIYFFLKAELLILDNHTDEVPRLFEQARRKLGKRIASQFYPYHFHSDTLVQFYEAWAFRSVSGMEAALEKLLDDKPFHWVHRLYDEIAAKAAKDVSNISIDEMQAELNRVIERMEGMLDDDIGGDVRDDFTEQIGAIRRRLEEKELRLALGGETSSGKTTFLNNIFETNLFFVTPEEATGIPTEIRYGDTVRIEVFDASDAQIDSLQLHSAGGERASVEDIEQARGFIERHTKVGGAEKAAVVRVYLPVDGLDKDLVIIDTPGFNAHQARTGIAEEVIKHSHACVFLIDARNALKAGEMKVIEATRSEVSKTFFVLNKMDLVVGDDELDVDDDPAEELKSRVVDTLRQHFRVDDVVVYTISSIPTSDLPQHLQSVAAPYRKQLFQLRENLFRETFAQRVHYLADAAAKEAIQVVEANRLVMERATESHHEIVRQLEDAIPTDLQLFQDEIYLRLDQTFAEARNRYNQEVGQLLDREFTDAINSYVEFLNSIQSKGPLKEQAQPKAKKITVALSSAIESAVRREQKRMSDTVLKELNHVITELYENLPFKVKNHGHHQTDLIKIDGASIITDDSAGLDSGELGMFGGAAAGVVIGALVLGPIGAAVGGWLGGSIFGKSIDTMKEELLDHFQSGLSDYYDKIVDQLNQQMDFTENSSFTQALNKLISQELEGLQELVQKEIDSKSREWNDVFEALLNKKQQQMEVLVAAERLAAIRLEHQRKSLIVKGR